MSTLFATERLVLRHTDENDAHHLNELDNDTEVMRYINGLTPVSMEIIRAQILVLFIQYDNSRSDIGFFAVMEKTSSTFPGWCCLRLSAESDSETNIGSRFQKTAWGRGFATEATHALIDLGFSQPGFNESPRQPMVKIRHHRG